MSAENLAESFLEAVDQEAERLETELGLERGGMRRSSDAVASVSFHGDGVVLTLACDRGEIDATLAPEGGEERPFQITMVLALAGVEDWRTRWPRIIGADTADRSVKLLVDDVLGHAGPWLSGDREALERLDDFRELELALKMAQFGAGRRPGDQWRPVRQAWERQDLQAMVEALDELEEPLREVEEKAGRYAERWVEHEPES